MDGGRANREIDKIPKILLNWYWLCECVRLCVFVVVQPHFPHYTDDSRVHHFHSTVWYIECFVVANCKLFIYSHTFMIRIARTVWNAMSYSTQPIRWLRRWRLLLTMCSICCAVHTVKSCIASYFKHQKLILVKRCNAIRWYSWNFDRPSSGSDMRTMTCEADSTTEWA